MRFETSQRIITDRSENEVLDYALLQFRKVSHSAKINSAGELVAKSIEATFGSINRADMTIVTARPTDDGVILVADVIYRPSVAFWILLIALAFTYIGWIFPIIFYLTHRSTVRNAVESCLRRVNDECARGLRAPVAASAPIAPTEQKSSTMDELAKLADLKDRGVLTDEEFASQKLRLLRVR